MSESKFLYLSLSLSRLCPFIAFLLSYRSYFLYLCSILLLVPHISLSFLHSSSRADASRGWRIPVTAATAGDGGRIYACATVTSLPFPRKRRSDPFKDILTLFVENIPNFLLYVIFFKTILPCHSSLAHRVELAHFKTKF